MEISPFFIHAIRRAPFRILILHSSNNGGPAHQALRCSVFFLFFSTEKLKFPGKPLQFNSSKRQQIAFAFNIFPCPQCSRTDAIGISNIGVWSPPDTPPGPRELCAKLNSSEYINIWSSRAGGMRLPSSSSSLLCSQSIRLVVALELSLDNQMEDIKRWENSETSTLVIMTLFNDDNGRKPRIMYVLV